MKIIVFEVVCLERKMLGVKCRICGNEKDNVKYVIKERILKRKGKTPVCHLLAENYTHLTITTNT